MAQIASVEGVVKGRSREAGDEYKLKVTWQNWSPHTLSCISLSDVQKVRGGTLPPDLCRMVSDRIGFMLQTPSESDKKLKEVRAAAAWWAAHPDNPAAQ